jgi:hypothetical protein
MIRATAKIAFLLSAAFLVACQSMPIPGVQRPASSPMEGRWASTDGIFVATFQGGNFTSRFTKTNEILAQGTYTALGNSIQMQWLSVATQQNRSANCTFTGPNSVHCNQTGGGGFDLTRAA